MMTEDYRLAAACPTESETVFDFLGRAPYPDNDSRMSVRYPDDWEAQVCSGDLAFDQSTDLAEVSEPANGGNHVVAIAPSPTATYTPASTPNPPPALRHIEQKRYMLDLINDKRVSAGLNPVVLGDNVAAQLHAEAALENCFSSHWGVDGLKPYVRYSLAGGYQSNAENVSGIDYCIKASDGFRANGPAEQEIREAMEGFMGSPGHRDNILRSWHKKVNIGLAFDRYNFQIVQHFEGDYVEYGQLPVIDKGVLRMSGTTKNGARFDDNLDSSVQVYYDPPPSALTRGQLARTYCYSFGPPAASLRPPLTGSWFYPSNEFVQTYKSCPDPYDVPGDAPDPTKPSRLPQLAALEAEGAKLEAALVMARQPQMITTPWITAQKWTANGDSFSITADLGDLLAKHGDGVYSIVVWGTIDGEDVVISEYSIFHGVTPPDTYNVDKSEGG